MYVLPTAFCYLIPFFIPIMWPVAWLFPSFLFFAIQSSRFLVLMLTCIGITILHLLPICSALVAMASDPLWLKLIGPLIFITYVSCFFFIWMIATQWILKKQRSLIARLITWTISFWLFLLSLDYIFLWPFGRIEGVPFFNPLLPMAYTSSMLAPLSYLPHSLVLLWFCIITSIVTFNLSCFSIKRSFVLILFIAPWIILAWQTPRAAPPAWLSTIGHLPISFPESLSLDAGQAIIHHELDQLLKKYPLLKIVILPESSWNGATLSPFPILEWLENHPIQDLIIGSFAQEKEAYYNCLYWYHKGIPIKRCEKQHAVPFVERITLNAKNLCSRLFFKKTPPVCPSKKQRSSLHIPGFEPLIPYICSDLYCNNWPDDKTTHTLLVTANDSWFMRHFQILMLLAARWRAVQWRRPLLYIAYHHAGYFDQYGNAIPITTTSCVKFGLFFDKVQKKDSL